MDIWSIAKMVFEALSGQSGVVLQVLSWLIGVVGTLRLIMKPIMVALRAIADATPSAADNEVLDNVEKSKVYSTVIFILDWLVSIKLPPKQ